jgi:hypothetical protein
MKTITKIIIAVAIVVVLGVGAAAAIILTADPYKKAETAYFKELIPSAANAEYVDGYSATYDFTYSINETVAGLIGLEPSDITFSGDMKATASAQQLSMYLSEGSDSLGGEIIMPGGENVYILMPDITEYVLLQKLSDTAEMPDIDLPSLLKTGAKISDIYFDIAKENGVYDKEDLINGGEVYSCDTFNIDFTGDIMYSLLSQSVEEMKKNESLMTYLNTMGEVQDTDLEAELDDMLDEAKDSLGEIGGDTVFTMKVYIYKGKIVGRVFENFNETDDMTFEFYDTEKGGVRNQLLEMKADYTSLKYTGDFTVADDKYTGEAVLELLDYDEPAATFTAAVNDLKYYPAGGFTEGEIELVIDIPDSDVAVNLDIEMTKDGLTQNAVIGGSADTPYMEIDFGKITASITIDPANPEIEEPSVDEEYLIEIEDPDEAKMAVLEEDIYAAIANLDTSGILYQIFGSALNSYY